jgi:tyrosine-protein kinase Etk/Wzc
MNIDQLNKNNDSLDLKELIFKYSVLWPYLILSLLVTLSVAYLVNKYSQPIYEVSTTILLKKEKPLIDMKGLSAFDDYNSQASTNDEIQVLRSIELTERVLDRVDFSISYIQKIPFDYRELYNESPFLIIPDSTQPFAYDALLGIKFNSDSTFNFSVHLENTWLLSHSNQIPVKLLNTYHLEKVYKCNELVSTPIGSFRVTPLTSFVKNDLLENKYFFVIRSKEALINEYRNYSINSSKSVNSLTVSMRGMNIRKMVDFLNALSSVYIEKSIERKLYSANNTIRFIETQLSEISDSLQHSERKLQSFQASNKVMDMNLQATHVYGALDRLQEKRAELVVKQKYIQYLVEYLKKNSDGTDFVAPSAIGIDDGVLKKLMDDLINLLNDKVDLSSAIKKNMPYLSNFDSRIENSKKTVQEYINNLTDATNLAIKSIDQQINDLSDKASDLPKKQQELFGYERVYKLNDAIYTYLLTKRSEIQISKAALIPDNEVVSKAHPRDSYLISPNKQRNYIYAFLIGLIIPILIFIILDFFNEKIRTLKEIEQISDFPILGHVIRDKSLSMVPVIEDPKSLLAESFRSIRTNFQFVASEHQKHVVLITSSMMGEGKSYTSMNLAASFALYNKKVVLLCFDLRKPMKNVPFGHSNEKGLSTYLSGNCDLDSIIQPTIHENLSFVFPGPIPPNPNELIACEKNKELFAKLKETYDYIIIDTPPIGMVADALLLCSFSDVNLYMIRHNYSQKSMIKNVFVTLKKRNVQNINIIVNDLPVMRNKYGYGLGYGYNYSYGYGYGYYQNEHESFFQKLKRKLLFKS